MAEGEEGGDARAPPVRLWVRRIGVYCDENQKTWLVAPEEASKNILSNRLFDYLESVGLFCFMKAVAHVARSGLLPQEAGTLKARIRRVPVPLGEAVRPSRLPASRLPHMWQLSEGQQYRDSNFRIWDIEHHLQIMGVEELLLRLLPSD
ncbi:PREDICTED: protein p13 MTCP-1 [Gekko japonicus]|uniref:Protein p13 MTCP-1 n=1 Tax=Gekko japonicus TaxID=146911 RepID=A0ABM1L7S6_GEKJA|nr:PREDICTED: protein p13 MTCP-1 [Gekko japonicus]XP_015282013.1 PREDICTED: protein p13 MTCP-1 [Gekko japonicus]